MQGGKLPQVPGIVAPAGYSKHSDWPINYASYIDQILGILMPNPEVTARPCSSATTTRLPLVNFKKVKFLRGPFVQIPPAKNRHGPGLLTAGSCAV